MQLVNEHNGLAFVFCQVFKHVFQPLFKFATELGARQQRSHVQGQHPLALERIGHLARHNALRQAFHNRRLAHAGLADEHRVVFGAALQHLDGASNLVVAANHRVELARAGALGQVYAVFFERLALVFGVRAVHVLAAPHGHNGGVQALARQPQRLHLLGKVRLGLAQSQHEQLAGNKLVAALDGLFLRRLQQAHHVAAHLHLFLALHLGQLFHGGVSGCQQGLHVHARALQQGLGAVLLAQHCRHDVGRFYIGMVLGQSRTLGVRQGFLKFGGEFVNAHMFLRCVPTWVPWLIFKRVPRWALV